MAIAPFWQNAFGGNVATSGVNPSPGLMGTAPATGSGLMGAPGTPQGDALMAFAGQLLAGSGYSPQRQAGSEIFGRALLAANQARAASIEQEQKRRYVEAQIAALEQEKRGQSPFGSIDPDQFTPESLAEFQHTGNYGVLKPRGGLSRSSLSHRTRMTCSVTSLLRNRACRSSMEAWHLSLAPVRAGLRRFLQFRR